MSRTFTAPSSTTWRDGAQCAVIGPGSSRTAHRPRHHKRKLGGPLTSMNRKNSLIQRNGSWYLLRACPHAQRCWARGTSPYPRCVGHRGDDPPGTPRCVGHGGTTPLAPPAVLATGGRPPWHPPLCWPRGDDPPGTPRCVGHGGTTPLAPPAVLATGGRPPWHPPLCWPRGDDPPGTPR